MAGIRDVAARAGVSTATVNRVLQGGATVSAPRTAQVLAAVAELGYVPNAFARGLTSGRSRLLGLLVPDITNPFFAELAQGLEARAAQHGYHALTASSHLDPGRERQFVTAFEDGTLAAVAITSMSSEPDDLRRLAGLGMPLAFVDRRPRGLIAPTVRIDNAAAARTATEHLLSYGHRNIAMIAGPPAFGTSSQRVRGFRAAMGAAGVHVASDHVRTGYTGLDGGERAMAGVLALEPRPTAVLSFNNLLAVGALHAIRDAHLVVPQDLSLVTFDDMSLFPFTDPPITAVAQPAHAMGAATADLLLGLLSGRVRADSPDVVFDTELITRQSVARPHPMTKTGGGSRP